MTDSPSAAPAPGAVSGAVSSPAGAAGGKRRFAALQSRNFRLLWFGMLISNAGTWMESTASGWLVTELQPDRAAFWLGGIAAAFAVPMLLLPPVGGAMADRFHRLRLLWIVQSCYLVLSTALALVTLLGIVNVWMLIAYAFGNGVVLALDSPTRHAFLPDILTRDELTSGVSLNSVAFTGAALVGPAIAGVLIPFVGVGGVMTLNAVSCVATLVALKRITGVPEHGHSRGGNDRILKSIGRGVRHILDSPMLSGLILVSTLSGLLIRSYGPLLAVFARDEFDVGSTAYGMLVSAGGLGTLIGAFGLAGLRDIRNKGQFVMVTTFVHAALLIVFALAPWFVAGVPLLALVGVMNAVSGASIATLIQLAVPPDLRGRVMSLYLLTVVGVPSIGAFVLGAVAVPLGVRVAVGGSAVMMLALSMVVFGRNKALRVAS
jgi:MFS family permease